MIVHVYNPERILNSTQCKSAVVDKLSTTFQSGANVNPTVKTITQQKQEINKPPPSPRMLRNSPFNKGYTTKQMPDPTKQGAASCLAKLKSSLDKDTMDSSSGAGNGTIAHGMEHPQLQPPPSWASSQQRGLAASKSASQVGASCTCHPAGSSIGLVAATNNDECKSNVSTESSQYITPSSSFNTVDNAKEIDSLDCKIEVAGSPKPIRKASLDRILSPKSGNNERSKVFTSSPTMTSTPSKRTSPDKSLSPVSSAVQDQLSNSLSNASIHSNYSEDSLMTADSKFGPVSQTPPYCHCNHYNGRPGPTSHPVSQRWNPTNTTSYGVPGLGNHMPPGKSNWNPDIGSSAAVESRPVKTLTPDSPIVSNCEPPPLSGDISKDSLNTSSSQAESPKLSSSIKCPSTSVDEANSRLGAASHSVASYPPNQSEPEEEDGEASKKPLEPLAFTIDFGDRSSVKSKKKETPKRFTDRLTSGQKRTPGQSTKPPSEEKKSENGGSALESTASTSFFSTAGERMLKSLSRVSDNPLTRFHHGDNIDVPGRLVTSALPASKSGRNGTGKRGNPNHSNGLEDNREPPVSRITSAITNSTLNTRIKCSSSPPPSAAKNIMKGLGVEPVFNNGVSGKSRSGTSGERFLETSNRVTQKTGNDIKMSASFSEVSTHVNYKQVLHRRSSLNEHRIETADPGRWLLDNTSLRDTVLDDSGLVDTCPNDTSAAGGMKRQVLEDHTIDLEQSSSDALVSGEFTSAEEQDDASETGTYTIGKDSPSPDEDQSRRDIDRVFGLIPDSEVSKMRSLSGMETESHSTPNWIREWAAQVAQQQEAPSPALSAPQSSKPPSAPRTLEAHSQRPRRRLPSVPPNAAGGSRSRSSPRPNDVSDPSDSSLETESFLRDTESVVSAMQARVDGRSSTESDIELRTSSAQQQQLHKQVEIEHSLGRKLSAQLRAKIRSLDEYSSSTSSTSRSVIRETSYVVSPTIIHNELHSCEDAKSVHSDSSSDITSGEATSRSRHTNHEDVKSSIGPIVRYNRALSLRRGRLGLDTNQSASSVNTTSGAISKDRRQVSNSPTRGSNSQVGVRKLSTSNSAPTSGAPGSSMKISLSATATGNSFSRNDGGRFSLRSVGSKSISSTASPATSNCSPTPTAGRLKGSKNISNIQGQNAPGGAAASVSGGNGVAAGSSGPRKSRSNSTLSSKEAEFQNWKRRKNYDPMKAAAEGKKKDAARKATPITMSQSMIGSVSNRAVDSCSSHSPSPPPRSIIRSASFTCVNNADSLPSRQTKEPQYNNGRRTSQHKSGALQHSSNLSSSEDESDIVFSPKQKLSPKPSPIGPRKFLGLSLSPSALNSPVGLAVDLSDLGSIASNDIELTSSPGSPRRKLYMEEGLLMRTSASNSSLRARTKLEALDNLVISTIHGLSSKIRTNSETLMRKLRPQYTGDSERLGLIDDSLNRLSECITESPIHSVTGGRSSSRELSGTLKVLKRIEYVFHALDQILFEDVLEGGGEEGAVMHDGAVTEGEDWNGYTSGEFY